MLVTHYEILPFAGKAASAGKTRIGSVAVLADLHDAQIGKENTKLIEAMEKAGIEAVLSAGDLMTVTGRPACPDHAVTLVRALAGRWPVYLCNGNHEMRLKTWKNTYPGLYDAYASKVREAGARLLDDASETFVLGKGWAGQGEDGLAIRITGLSLDLPLYDRIHKGKLSEKEIFDRVGAPAKRGTYQILLAHHPDYFPAYAGWGADLVLSGHLHGGMIRLPLLGGVIGATLRPFPRFDRGSFELGSSRMIVSSGLSEHSVKLRWNNPPELVILDFYASWI